MSFPRRQVSGRPRQTRGREDRHIVRNARVQPTASSAAIHAQETGLQRNGTRSSLGTNPDSISAVDNPVRVWRCLGERLNPAFALQRHTAPSAGVMVWGAIAYNTRSPLVLIRGTMTTQRHSSLEWNQFDGSPGWKASSIRVVNEKKRFLVLVLQNRDEGRVEEEDPGERTDERSEEEDEKEFGRENGRKEKERESRSPREEKKGQKGSGRGNGRKENGEETRGEDRRDGERKGLSPELE
ncbi:transposable element Tcb2 transposase [Trichonephila clavipes]|nr:transposable element Tcb2 transposase [Trichonephila clavipes]